MDGQLMCFGLETSGFTAEKRTHFLTRQAVHGQSTMQAVATFFVGFLPRRNPDAWNSDIFMTRPVLGNCSNPARGDAKRKTAATKAPRFSPLMDGARTSWLVQRFYRRAYLVVGPLPKIAMDHSQLPLGRMVGLLAYRNYGRLRLRHTECVQYECTLHRIFFQTIEAPAFTHVSSAHIGVE